MCYLFGVQQTETETLNAEGKEDQKVLPGESGEIALLQWSLPPLVPPAVDLRKRRLLLLFKCPTADICVATMLKWICSWRGNCNVLIYVTLIQDNQVTF